MKQVKRYAVRYWPNEVSFSRQVGNKVLPFRKAQRIVKRLRRSGVEAFVSNPYRIAA